MSRPPKAPEEARLFPLRRPARRRGGVARVHATFADDAIHPLETESDASEIQAERVKFLRYGEARGDYDKVVTTSSALDPHWSWRACEGTTPLRKSQNYARARHAKNPR